MTSEMENETKTTEEKQEIDIAELKPKMSNLIVTFNLRSLILVKLEK
jgi:hypothetical protein